MIEEHNTVAKCRAAKKHFNYFHLGIKIFQLLRYSFFITQILGVKPSLCNEELFTTEVFKESLQFFKNHVLLSCNIVFMKKIGASTLTEWSLFNYYVLHKCVYGFKLNIDQSVSF